MSFTRSLSPLLAVVLLAAACGPKAHDVTAPFVAGSYTPTGTVDVVLNDPTGALTVSVNDHLVVDRKVSRKATITGVPAGVARVQVAIGGGCEQGATFEREVDVMPGAVTTVTLPGPELSTGCAIYNGLYYVGLNVGLAAMSIALVAAAAPRLVRGK